MLPTGITFTSVVLVIQSSDQAEYNSTTKLGQLPNTGMRLQDHIMTSIHGPGSRFSLKN